MAFSITLEQRKSEASYAIRNRQLGYLKVLIGETAVIAKYTRDDVRKLSDLRDQQWVLRATLVAVDALNSSLTSLPAQALTNARKKELLTIFKETWLRQSRIVLESSESSTTAESSSSIQTAATASASTDLILHNQEKISLFANFEQEQQVVLSRAFPTTLVHAAHLGMRLDWTVSPLIRKKLQDDYPETRMEEQLQKNYDNGSVPISSLHIQLHTAKTADQLLKSLEPYRAHISLLLSELDDEVRAQEALVEQLLRAAKDQYKKESEAWCIEATLPPLLEELSSQFARWAEMSNKETSSTRPLQKSNETEVSSRLPMSTPLSRALMNGSLDINTTPHEDGRTLLAMAVSIGYEEAVELLLQSGASMVIPDAHGATPSSLAVASQNESIKYKFSQYSKRELQFPQDPEVKWFLTKTEELQDVLTRDVHDHALMLKHEPGTAQNEEPNNDQALGLFFTIFNFLLRRQPSPSTPAPLTHKDKKVLQKEIDHALQAWLLRHDEDLYRALLEIKDDPENVSPRVIEPILGFIKKYETNPKYGRRRENTLVLQKNAYEVTYQRMERERAEDKAVMQVQATQIRSQATQIETIGRERAEDKAAIKLLQEQVAQLLLLSASVPAPSPLAARVAADDRGEAAITAESVPRNFHRDGMTEVPAPSTSNGEGPKPPSPVLSTHSLDMDM